MTVTFVQFAPPGPPAFDFVNPPDLPTCQFPSAITPGNELVAYVWVGANPWTGGAPTVSITGWTLRHIGTGSPGGRSFLAMLTRTAGVAEPTTITLTTPTDVQGSALLMAWETTPVTTRTVVSINGPGLDGPTLDVVSAPVTGLVIAGLCVEFEDPGARSVTGTVAFTTLSTTGDISGGSLIYVWTGYAASPAAASVTFDLVVQGDGWSGEYLVLDDSAPPVNGAGFWIDFDKDGFSGTDERTADLIALTWNRGGTPDLVGGVQPGQATAVLNNTSGDYNPDNAAGPFYGKLVPGLPMWFGANSDGTLSGSADPVYGLFAGLLREVTPIAVAGAGPDATPTVEMLFEDPLGWYSRQKAQVSGAVDRSQKAFRTAVLAAIPESLLDLDDEITTLPFSAADTQDALTLLTTLNAANGTRHFAQPADVRSDWYAYTTRNRQYKLGAVADQSFDASVLADGLTGFNGWRMTDDPVINDQQASIDPIDIPAFLVPVWQYQNPTVSVSSTAPVTIIASFAQPVLAPEAEYTSTGSVTVTLTPFGSACKIAITSGSSGVVLGLQLLGHPVLSQAGVTVSKQDATSITQYGTRTGVSLSGPLLGVQASAQGIVDHLVWRFAQPLKRPQASITNALAKVFPLELYDLVSLTVAELSVTARLFEIVGLTGRCIRAAGTGGAPEVILFEHDYQVQESRLQAPFTFFTWDVSKWNDATEPWAY